MTTSVQPTKRLRRFTGPVGKAAMTKTIVVKVSRTKIHPIYHKRFAVSTKYKVHDAKGEYRVGDVIEFVECRPLSKDKRWRAIKKVS